MLKQLTEHPQLGSTVLNCLAAKDVLTLRRANQSMKSSIDSYIMEASFEQNIEKISEWQIKNDEKKKLDELADLEEAETERGTSREEIRERKMALKDYTLNSEWKCPDRFALLNFGTEWEDFLMDRYFTPELQFLNVKAASHFTEAEKENQTKYFSTGYAAYAMELGTEQLISTTHGAEFSTDLPTQIKKLEIPITARSLRALFLGATNLVSVQLQVQLIGKEKTANSAAGEGPNKSINWYDPRSRKLAVIEKFKKPEPSICGRDSKLLEGVLFPPTLKHLIFKCGSASCSPIGGDLLLHHILRNHVLAAVGSSSTTTAAGTARRQPPPLEILEIHELHPLSAQRFFETLKNFIPLVSESLIAFKISICRSVNRNSQSRWMYHENPIAEYKSGINVDLQGFFDTVFGGTITRQQSTPSEQQEEKSQGLFSYFFGRKKPSSSSSSTSMTNLPAPAVADPRELNELFHPIVRYPKLRDLEFNFPSYIGVGDVGKPVVGADKVPLDSLLPENRESVITIFGEEAPQRTITGYHTFKRNPWKADPTTVPILVARPERLSDPTASATEVVEWSTMNRDLSYALALRRSCPQLYGIVFPRLSLDFLRTLVLPADHIQRLGGAAVPEVAPLFPFRSFPLTQFPLLSSSDSSSSAAKIFESSAATMSEPLKLLRRIDQTPNNFSLPHDTINHPDDDEVHKLLMLHCPNLRRFFHFSSGRKDFKNILEIPLGTISDLLAVPSPDSYYDDEGERELQCRPEQIELLLQQNNNIQKDQLLTALQASQLGLGRKFFPSNLISINIDVKTDEDIKNILQHCSQLVKLQLTAKEDAVLSNRSGWYLGKYGSKLVDINLNFGKLIKPRDQKVNDYWMILFLMGGITWIPFHLDCICIDGALSISAEVFMWAVRHFMQKLTFAMMDGDNKFAQSHIKKVRQCRRVEHWTPLYSDMNEAASKSTNGIYTDRYGTSASQRSQAKLNQDKYPQFILRSKEDARFGSFNWPMARSGIIPTHCSNPEAYTMYPQECCAGWDVSQEVPIEEEEQLIVSYNQYLEKEEEGMKKRGGGEQLKEVIDSSYFNPSCCFGPHVSAAAVTDLNYNGDEKVPYEGMDQDDIDAWSRNTMSFY